MAGRPVWPGIFPGARLSRAHKAKIIEAFDPSGTVKEARSMGFGRLAGVRRDGPDPNGVPPDASVMTQRVVARWEGDGHSHGHMALREFVKRKILDDNTLAEAAKSKLQGGDPIAEYLGDCVDESNDITLDDNTRVVFFFDN